MGGAQIDSTTIPRPLRGVAVDVAVDVAVITVRSI
jgi:hypothetical protein